MRRKHFRIATLALALALITVLAGSALMAVGCGSGENASEILLAAVDKTSGLYSVKADFSLQAVTSDSGLQPPLFGMDGTMAVDFTTNSMDVSSSLPFIGTPVCLRMVDGALYLNMSGIWMSDPESLLGSVGLQLVGKSLPTFGDLFQLMRYFSQVRKLGSESIDGVDCDHLAMQPDYSKISAEDSIPEFLQTLVGGSQVANEVLRNSNLTVEAWIAKDSGYVKQAVFSFKVELPKLPVLEMFLPQGPASFQVAMMLSGYNEPVKVEVPRNTQPASSANL